MNRSWYVLWVKPKREPQVASQLENRGMEVFFPMIRPRRVPFTGLLEPLFSCYLFCKLDVQTEEILIARSAIGVRRLLGSAAGPTPVPEEVVQAIQLRLEHENNPTVIQQFEPGQRVLIGAGPFKDLEAIFDRRLSAAGRVRVFINMVGKQWSVQVDSSHLMGVSRFSPARA